ncbi:MULTISPECIES: ABC transporter substrate-binding protein [unclassified Rhizobium]|uniref:ABC transporter substrate-binding protein n=1 Tax=unclassified Rhizobium TaxID=2613769 RepID=UPI001A990A73|nr:MULTISPECIES: ABC transporter substrate-binding protein [unclassified Rhizobium]MBX5159299.1 ABC transporter substrate-binding protein [Rhizobium sp. NZLR8]MBX5162043.1 ABC transporter substrate-binding protein [Rhizobium sp. NZLR4b]MBX5171083.1 ABC transporter substrate-binding protein [Rhizobium sp. NZLR1b]MBX5181197.1 ABC transporter substrate-binding protein [Rhizobium sp. NZLR5]MBX5188102.1 ABC transporter substrate-binding protein [Rhizobium sp. NZLR3b]
MSLDQSDKTNISRRNALKLGLAAGVGLTVFGMNARIVTADEGQVLKVAHPAFDQDWSPLRGGGRTFRWNSIWWASPMYFDSQGKIKPYVFTSWESADNAVWTFKIDPKAVFSDGSKITSADVKGSWEVASMPNTKSQRADQVLSKVKGYAEIAAGSGKELTGVATPDEGTVVVTLTAADPIFFMRLANHIAPITKASQSRGSDGEEIIDWYKPDSKPAFSGPFKLTSIDIDAGKLTFEPNENFFGPKPKLARIEVTSIEDNVTATSLIKSGEFNAHTELVTSTIIQDLGPEFSAGPLIPTSQHFWFNISRAPMDDPKVRQALIMAIDRDGLFKASYPDGPHKKADQILNSVPGAEDSGFEPFPFDPAAAKKLLAESSYGGPERLPKIMFVGISAPAIQAAAQFIAEQWRQNLGITAVDMKPQQDAYAGPDQNSVQIFRDDVGTRVPDAVSYLAGCIASTSSNAQNKLGGYKNDKVDSALTEATTKAADDPQRIALAQEAQKAFRDDWAFIPWYSQAMSRWATKEVKGLDKNLDWQIVEPWNISIG